jgi:hypothetical protein
MPVLKFIKKVKALEEDQGVRVTTQTSLQGDIALFCHSPVFPIINIFYKGGILGNTAFAHLILAISLL